MCVYSCACTWLAYSGGHPQKRGMYAEEGIKVIEERREREREKEREREREKIKARFRVLFKTQINCCL